MGVQYDFMTAWFVVYKEGDHLAYVAGPFASLAECAPTCEKCYKDWPLGPRPAAVKLAMCFDGPLSDLGNLQLHPDKAVDP